MAATRTWDKDALDFAVAAMGNPKSKPKTNRERLICALNAMADAGYVLVKQDGTSEGPNVMLNVAELLDDVVPSPTSPVTWTHLRNAAKALREKAI